MRGVAPERGSITKDPRDEPAMNLIKIAGEKLAKLTNV
jgi:hypothetical protein